MESRPIRIVGKGLARCALIPSLFTLLGAGLTSCGEMDLDPTAPTCDGGRLDQNTFFCWQEPRASETYTLEEAIEYCENLSLGGHDDWILPDVKDFMGMLGGCDFSEPQFNLGTCNSCIDSDTCTALFGTDENTYMAQFTYYEDLFGA